MRSFRNFMLIYIYIYQGGSVSIYLRVVGSHYWRVLSQVFQRTFYLFLLFLKLWLLDWKVFRGIFFGGLLRGVSNTLWWLGKMVSLTPGLTTMWFGVLRILCLRVFGNQRFQSEWLSFCGQLLMIGFLLWIISCLGVAFWQIGVVCVVVMGSQWTTFFFIVLLHIPYGLLCFRLLV